MDAAPVYPLAVTTSGRDDRALQAQARAAAAEGGVPYLPRREGVPLTQMLRDQAAALVVFEAGAVVLTDSLGTLRFSRGMAHLRIKQLDAGVTEDMLLKAAELRAGDSVLDCTLGLGADAQVAARIVGPEGQVVGIEKSTALYLLVRHGLPTLPAHPHSARLEVRHADAAEALRALPNAAFDVVFFDPMWGRSRPASQAFEALRRYADYQELTQGVLQEARRVARRAVVIKGSRYSQDLKKLGVQPLPSRRSPIAWARLAPSP